MSLTESTMQDLGASAPGFELTDTKTGGLVSLDMAKSDKATVVMFICNHCPYVQHVIQGIVNLANDYIPKGVSFVGISANDAESYPEDSPEMMKQYAERLKYPFPYLYDKTQEVAKSYDAVCTPDFFIYDSDLKLVYRGRLDGASPGNQVPVTGEDIRKALDKILSGDSPDPEQYPSMGCNIKWRQN